jgi:CRP-like cAMP-binding protein
VYKRQLYERLLERLVEPDAARQGARAADHPWFPVLAIGGEKAALYTRALVGDIVHKRRHLSDPGWLLRVGLYLEFLTFLGIAAALPGAGLLSPAERAAFERGERFAALRARIDPAAWRAVWELRDVRRGARNLLAKRRATLAFLHAHHRDLQHAIELAGPNEHNAQETWQRVFRDAERAVLARTSAAFPELAQLPEPARGLVREGLYATACREYRASLNTVAAWGRERGLMDYTGAECVPASASLFGAGAGVLERRDGAGGGVDVPVETVAGVLASVPLFAPLDAAQRRDLAATARPVALGPGERLVVQGQPGTSLFVIAGGLLEVVLRRGGEDVAVDVLAPGDVAGEMSLLTGEPRCATLRCLDEALVYEIGRRQYAALLLSHPDLVEGLAALMDERLRGRRQRLRRRLRRFLYSQGAAPGGPRISIPKRAAVAAITAGSGGSGSGGSVAAPAGRASARTRPSKRAGETTISQRAGASSVTR